MPSEEAIRALPKVELHCHLDGAARPGTILEVAREAGIPLPADDVEGLLPHVRVAPGCHSLRDFLAVFETFYPVLSVPGAMERVAYERMHDAATDGVVHVELRFCPALQATDAQDAEQVLEAILAGAGQGARETGVGFGAIVCCYRPLPVEVNEHLVDIALSHADRGVVGMDLAGPEDLSGAPCAPALARAREGGLPVTVHAGEAAGSASVREAIELLGASRLGHGVALREDAALRRRVAEAGLPLECCPTSNVQTCAVASLDTHPLPDFDREGLKVTLNTDDPSVCGVTLTDEYRRAAEQWGYDLADLRRFSLQAVEAAFLDDDARAALRRRVESGAG